MTLNACNDKIRQLRKELATIKPKHLPLPSLYRSRWGDTYWGYSPEDKIERKRIMNHIKQLEFNRDEMLSGFPISMFANEFHFSCGDLSGLEYEFQVADPLWYPELAEGTSA